MRDFEANMGFDGIARKNGGGSSSVALSITLSVVKGGDREAL
jgi:hypothetical protein